MPGTTKESETSASSSRLVAWAQLAVVLGMIGIIASCGVWIFKNQRGVEQDADDFLQALAHGDGNSACARMTGFAQSALAAQYKADTCPQAVAALIRPLSTAQREQLARTRATQSTDRGSSLGHMDLSSNPLQLTHVDLSRVDGKWLVTQLG